MKTDAPVLIAGGGPVGMTLALELARHDIGSVLFERNLSTTRHPKMDLTNGRSMELYRRLGLSKALRDVGVPPDHSFDIMWATSPSAHLLHRFAYPSPSEADAAVRHANDGSGPAEPGMRISQIILEPVLKAALDRSSLVQAHFGCAFERLSQDEDGVSVDVRDEKTSEVQSFQGRYLIGCDGGGSRVRRHLGIALEGQQNIGRILMIHFRSTDRDLLNPWGVAWHLQTAMGSLVAQDDCSTWTLHVPLPPGADETQLDPADVLRRFVGRDFDFEILIANPWAPHLVIAERYRDRRVFIAGDAAHQVIPTGGYGMNTGVGDAIDLGWKLAAVVNGWGGDGLLESYEWERRRVAVDNRTASERHFGVRIKIAEAYAAAEASGPLDEVGPAGDARRAELGGAIAALGNAENESWGVEHGYRYVGSPVVVGESLPPTPFDPLVCAPTTYPGARLPHVFLADGEPLLDRLGPEFTLLKAPGADAEPLVASASHLGIPLSVVEVTSSKALDLLERRLVLVRPDQHVAWRGDTAPDDPKAVWATTTGHLEVSTPAPAAVLEATP